MADEIRTRLLKIDTEAIWRTLEGEGTIDVPAQQLFAQFSDHVLDIYTSALSVGCSGWICVAGITPGYLEPIARQLRGQTLSPRKIARHKAQELASGARVRLLSPRDSESAAEHAAGAGQLLRVSLIGFDELYGLMFLHSSGRESFSDADLALVQESEVTLNRLMADENFSMRLTNIAAPLDIDSVEITRADAGTVIANRACLGFGADAAVIRLRSNETDEDLLPPLGTAGLVADELLVSNGHGERIARTVLDSVDGIAVCSYSPSGERESLGASIAPADDEWLRNAGYPSYMVMRLQSDLKVGEYSRFGTLSILHQSPQRFSRRDVGLFRSFCERVADDFALLDQRAENEAMLRVLKAQDQLGTRAEITALLGHDFGHKVLAVESDLVDFVDSCKKQLTERRLPERLQQRSEQLLKATDNLKQIVAQLRMLGQGLEEEPLLFNVVDDESTGKVIRGVFREISETLSTALERNNMSLALKAEGNCRIFGVRSILMQALYNLIINSIDAQRGTKKRRSNTVYIQCRETAHSSYARVVEFKVWDEGPGINRAAFPDESKIFDVGTTSKPKGVGTGTGLPVARSLLGKYFHADLQLRDRTKALFQFNIPVRSEREKKQ